MRSFVISLPRTPDRLTTFAAGWEGCPWTCDAFCAIDGSKLSLPPQWTHCPGSFGLSATYMTLFGFLLAEGYSKPFAVFEDDCKFTDNWWEEVDAAVAELPPDWWMLYLGPHVGSDTYENPSIVSPRLGRLHHSWRTHAAIYNPAKLPAMMMHLLAKDRPVDVAWCDLQIGVDAPPSNDFYVTRRFLVGTIAGVSICTGRIWGEFKQESGWNHPNLVDPDWTPRVEAMKIAEPIAGIPLDGIADAT